MIQKQIYDKAKSKNKIKCEYFISDEFKNARYKYTYPNREK